MREEGFAALFSGFVTWLLQQGMPPTWTPYVVLSLELVTLLLLLVLVYWATRVFLLQVVRRVFGKSESPFVQILLKPTVLKALTNFTPAVVFLLLAPTVFREFEEATPVLATVAYLYLLLVLLRSILTFLDATRDYFRLRPAFKNRPIDIWVQVAKIGAYAVAIILCIALLAQQPPAIVIGGLGATSAVLMLVFRDTLLGFVAGIQLYALDMVRLGDWIEMDKYGANGEVTEISLTTVKVRNWDRTMTTVPTYALISDSVKNWRYMSAGGARRIKRPLLVDVNSVKPCTPEMLERFEALEATLPPALPREGPLPEPPGEPEPGATNLGMFRRYVEAYLQGSDKISQNQTLMVRHLDSIGDGIPLEVYAFTSDSRWVVYEKIQAELFEHLFAMAPQYQLEVFQAPAGRDLQEAVGASPTPP